MAGPSRPEDAEGKTLFRLEPAKDFDVYSDRGGGERVGGGGRGLTSDVIFVGGVDLFYSPVAEGQFPHPVHAAPHARGQAEVGAGGGRVEAVGGKVVRAEAETETGRAVSEGAEPERVGRKKKDKWLPEILAVVVGGHVVDVHLVAFLQTPNTDAHS